MKLSSAVLLSVVWAVAITSLMLLCSSVASAQRPITHTVTGEFETNPGEWHSFSAGLYNGFWIETFDASFSIDGWEIVADMEIVDAVDPYYYDHRTDDFEMLAKDVVFTDPQGVDRAGNIYMVTTGDLLPDISFLTYDGTARWDFLPANYRNWQYTAVPEPSAAALGLMAVGLAMFAWGIRQ